MEYANVGLAVIVLCCLFQLSPSEDATTTTDAPSKPGRIGRKYYDSEVYTGSDVEAVPLSEHGFQPRSLVAKKYIPYRQAGSGIMKKTGNNPNWNAWRGDDDDDDNNSDDSGHNDGGPKWQPPPQGWGSDAWAADPMYVMMLKNAMTDLKGEDKPSGLLSKLTSEPALLLVAASIPISLLLAAVLPALMSYVSGGSNMVPTVSTTATGTRARSGQSELLPYLAPVLEAVGTFGVRSVANPDCMQRIFCQVAQDKVFVKSPGHFRKAAAVAKYLADSSDWLGDFGVGELVDSLSSGDCERIPCTDQRGKKAVKSRHGQKSQSNSVQ